MVAFPQFMPVYHTYLLTEVLIYLIFALSLNLLMGYTGLVSLGHAAFWGTGGYAVALLMSKGGVDNFFLCTGVALLASAILAMIFGFLALRTSGVYFIMITLALGQMLWALAWRWESFTGGSNGLHGVTRPDFLASWSQVNSTSFYYLTLITVIPTILLIYRITTSPFGKTLVGIRENEPRMQALGYNTWRYKYSCYVLAAIFGALAGALKVFQDGSINPGSSSITISGLVVLMVLTGGSGSFAGPILGAGVVWTIKSIVSSYTAYWGAVLGIILVIIVMFSPQGITPLFIKPIAKLNQRLWNP
ncbi:MAG: branched-chain amino acid ABC transporter permease [Desulfobacteraceae bacterium]|nr:branched-chain amino acid ABC transporter permease [Desulfobacteraceae bacterium]